MKQGDIIRVNYDNQYTVLEVIDEKMIQTYEDFNNLIHITKCYKVG